MKKVLLLIFPLALSAVTYSSTNSASDDRYAPTQEVQVIRSQPRQGQQYYNQPYYQQNRPNPYSTYNRPPGSYREFTSQNAWHNQSDNESYYNDPNWPNVKRR